MTLRQLKDARFFFHNGSLTSVKDVVRYFNAGVPQDAQAGAANTLTTRFTHPRGLGSPHGLGLSHDQVDDLTDFIENGLYDPAFVHFDPDSPTRMFELSPPDVLYSVYRPDLAALGAIDGRPASGLPQNNDDALSRRDAPSVIAEGGILPRHGIQSLERVVGKPEVVEVLFHELPDAGHVGVVHLLVEHRAAVAGVATRAAAPRGREEESGATPLRGRQRVVVSGQEPVPRRVPSDRGAQEGRCRPQDGDVVDQQVQVASRRGALEAAACRVAGGVQSCEASAVHRHQPRGEGPLLDASSAVTLRADCDARSECAVLKPEASPGISRAKGRLTISCEATPF